MATTPETTSENLPAQGGIEVLNLVLSSLKACPSESAGQGIRAEFRRTIALSGLRWAHVDRPRLDSTAEFGLDATSSLGQAVWLGP